MNNYTDTILNLVVIRRERDAARVIVDDLARRERTLTRKVIAMARDLGIDHQQLNSDVAAAGQGDE